MKEKNMEDLNVVMKLAKRPKLFTATNGTGYQYVVAAFTAEEATELIFSICPNCFHSEIKSTIKECTSGVCYGYKGDILEYNKDNDKKSW
jgi:hypothetical protein